MNPLRVRRSLPVFVVIIIGLPLMSLETGPARGWARQDAKPTKLVIAFASTRERWDPPYPKIHFYEHDGVSKGKLLESIDTISKGVNKSRADMHPALSADGRYCAFASQLGVANGGQTEIWDRKEKKLLPLPGVHGLLKTHQMHATFSANGKRLAFTAWAWPGSSGRWNVFLYDVPSKKIVDVPKLNVGTFDQRMPALSADGRFLAFASNARGGAGRTDIYLYDLKAKTPVALPGLNSKEMDISPSLSGDGRLIAFTSDRPGGVGNRDIYLYDRVLQKLLPLPGLNSPAHEQSPSLSADGRFLAFVSERLKGAGERDIYLYDRVLQKLLPTPGLNSKHDDIDPFVLTVNGK
ncbi:MAG: PD40 domain-containing protein [Planctomycetes bacterium]|nr:PD40 domain-containing protein [Planctomycetota bacterium]